MKQLWENLWQRFHRRDRFLVLELSPREVRVTRLAVDFNRKEIERGETVSAAIEGGTGYDEVRAHLTRLLRRFRFARPMILVSLDPRFATTLHAPVVLVREKPREAVDEADLDNRVAQSLSRIFNRGRARAAKKMAVGELDAVLADVAVKRVKLDGHRVVNPVGFPARTLEFEFIETFVARPLLEFLRGLFPLRRLRFLAERGTMIAALLEYTSGSYEFALIEILEEETHVIVAEGASLGWTATITWGRLAFYRAFQDAFGVSSHVAGEMFDLYLVRQGSPGMLRAFEKLLIPVSGDLARAIGKTIGRLELKELYITAPFKLPPFLFGTGFRETLPSRMRSIPFEGAALIRELGFECRGAGAHENIEAFPALATLLSFYFLPHDDSMTRIARRHARWLISEERDEKILLK